MEDRPNRFTNIAFFYITSLVMVDYRRGISLILLANTFDIILASALTSDMGLQFSINVRSLPFFSVKVITACLWELDISSLSKDSLTQSMKGLLMRSQQLL